MVAPTPYSPDDLPSNRPVHVVLDRGRGFGWGRRLPWVLLAIALFFAFGMYSSYRSYMQRDPRIEEKFFSHSPSASNKVAIITIEGAIMHNDGFAKWQIDQVRRDPDVKAVVVRVDSPGGTVTGSDYLFHHLKQLREGAGTERPMPLVVSMGAIAASGGYYLSMAAGGVPDTIFAERTTWTGSIGVIIPHFNASELLESWRIKDDSVVSGPLKAMASPTRVLTPEMAEREHQVLQTLVNESFEQFKDVVREGRPSLFKDPANVEKATTGQVFNAKQALELGLVDKLGFLEDAVDRAIQLANLKADDVRVVNYSQPRGLLDSTLFGASAASGTSVPQLNVSALVDLATPRAYFLYTWMPALLTNR
jgi:protease IV